MVSSSSLLLNKSLQCFNWRCPRQVLCHQVWTVSFWNLAQDKKNFVLENIPSNLRVLENIPSNLRVCGYWDITYHHHDHHHHHHHGYVFAARFQVGMAGYAYSGPCPESTYKYGSARRWHVCHVRWPVRGACSFSLQPTGIHSKEGYRTTLHYEVTSTTVACTTIAQVTYNS